MPSCLVLMDPPETICTYVVVHIIGESEYDHDEEEEEEEFIREGIENALRAKERLEKAEFLEVCTYMYIHHVPIIISYAEAEKR